MFVFSCTHWRERPRDTQNINICGTWVKPRRAKTESQYGNERLHEQLRKAFREYCSPQKNVTYERHKFNIRNQTENESIDQYVTELRTLASTCKFENLKDGLIRDRVIWGIRNQALKERLLREASLTLKSAVNICRAAEALTDSPHANIDELNQSVKQSYQHRNYSAQQRNESSTGRLFNCGNCGQQHAAKSCPAYGKRCNNCHKIGHFAKLCRSTKNTRFCKCQTFYPYLG